MIDWIVIKLSQIWKEQKEHLNFTWNFIWQKVLVLRIMFRDTSGVIIIQVLKPQDIIFHFLDPPKVFLKFGSNIDMSNVVEGSDVYFDCDIDSNPEVYKVEWTKNVSDYI